jgi:hypothetical protein
VNNLINHNGRPDLSNLNYDPEHFRSIFESELGQAIWSYLREDDNVIRMLTASYLKRAAVEPLQPGLLAKFGVAVTADRLKQFIGHAVRRIMEANHYHLDRQGTRILQKDLFTSGSRYRPNAELLQTLEEVAP